MPCVSDILNALFEWAPAPLAWERDNIGLLVGSESGEVCKLLVCLDVTPAVVQEAMESGVDLIVAHHPIIFQPIRRIRTDQRQGKMLAELLSNGISVIAMHTNVDATWNGLNFTLAARLGLHSIRPLQKFGNHNRIIRSIVGMESSDSITGELQEQGIQAAVLNRIGDTVQLEVHAPSWNGSKIQSIFQRHGAESYSLMTEEPLRNYGLGAIGELGESQAETAFLVSVKDMLHCAHLRHTPLRSNRQIKTVAVCGGSGSSLITDALQAKADAFVTADVTHHTFLDNGEDILLVDAGHHETEFVFIEACRTYLQSRFLDDSQEFDILGSRVNTNPIRFF
jgi:dinuclear metal center YbgI/SA1388 family protein